MTGDIERLLAFERPVDCCWRRRGDPGHRSRPGGTCDEARRAAARHAPARRDIPLFQSWTDYLMAWLDRVRGTCSSVCPAFGALKILDDPEAMFQEGWLLCDVGEHQRRLDHLRRAVAKGYFAAPTLANSRQFDALRSDPAFQALLADAESGPPAGAGCVPRCRRRAASPGPVTR